MKKSYRKFKIISEQQLYYLAGILDGAACFFIGTQAMKGYSKGFVWKGCISITSCDASLILFLSDMLFERSQIATCTPKNNDRKLHNIKIDGPILDDLLPRLVKILIVKKEHAELLLQFRMSFGEDDHCREQLRQRMKTLNSFAYKKSIAKQRETDHESVSRKEGCLREIEHTKSKQ